jgi:lipoteichoic acid synthase
MMVTLTNHTPFKMDAEYCTIDLQEKHQDTRFGNYLNSVAYTDYAIGVLIDELKESGLYENSVIAIYGDHFGLAQYDEDNGKLLTEFLNKPYRFDEMANIPLIIHIPGQDINETISIAGGQMDFLPTIAYLLGFESLDTLYLRPKPANRGDGLCHPKPLCTFRHIHHRRHNLFYVFGWCV